MTIFAAISLALIIFGINAAWAAGGDNNRMYVDRKPGPIVYSVTVHLSEINAPCNVYWVMITDHMGQAIAQPQVYIPGKSVYNFYEPGLKKGARVARFVQSPYLDSKVCRWPLYAVPDFKFGTFHGGQIYRFDLYPVQKPLND